MDRSIAILDQIKLETQQFWSKCEWTKSGDKCSKMFFSLEKERYLRKNMKCIITECSRHITDQKEILTEQTKFYKGLHSNDPKVHFKFTRTDKENYLTEENKNNCKQELQMDELFDAVMTLKCNKCPGGDGLTVEFYQKFYKSLFQPLYLMCLHAFET